MHTTGRSTPRLIELAAELVPRLPALGAIVFEILPQYIEPTGLDRIAAQLGQLQSLWALRRPRHVAAPRAPAIATPAAHELAALADWERTLASAALGRDLGASPQALADDPGAALFNRLVGEFRSGHVVRVLRYSMLLLLRSLGPRRSRGWCRPIAAPSRPTCTRRSRPTASPVS
jgi:hypothetical protein